MRSRTEKPVGKDSPNFIEAGDPSNGPITALYIRKDHGDDPKTWPKTISA